MTLHTEVSFHAIASVEIKHRVNTTGTTFWTDFVMKDREGNIVAEVCAFGGERPVVVREVA